MESETSEPSASTGPVSVDPRLSEPWMGHHGEGTCCHCLPYTKTPPAVQQHCRSSAAQESCRASLLPSPQDRDQQPLSKSPAPSQMFSGGVCCELSHLWLNHSYLGGWSEGQGQLSPKETRVHHVRVLTDPLFIQRTWIEYILYAGYCEDTETRGEGPWFPGANNLPNEIGRAKFWVDSGETLRGELILIDYLLYASSQWNVE